MNGRSFIVQKKSDDAFEFVAFYLSMMIVLIFGEEECRF